MERSQQKHAVPGVGKHAGSAWHSSGGFLMHLRICPWNAQYGDVSLARMYLSLSNSGGNAQRPPRTPHGASQGSGAVLFAQVWWIA